MEYLIATIIGLATGIAVMVLAEKAPRASRWMIRRGASFYPVPQAERFEEEWLAHLATRDGPYSMLWHGLGCLTTGIRRGAAHNRVKQHVILFFVLTIHSVIGILSEGRFARMIGTEYKKEGIFSLFAAVAQLGVRFLLGLPLAVCGILAIKLSKTLSSSHPAVIDLQSEQMEWSEIKGAMQSLRYDLISIISAFWKIVRLRSN